MSKCSHTSPVTQLPANGSITKSFSFAILCLPKSPESIFISKGRYRFGRICHSPHIAKYFSCSNSPDCIYRRLLSGCCISIIATTTTHFQLKGRLDSNVGSADVVNMTHYARKMWENRTCPIFHISPYGGEHVIIDVVPFCFVLLIPAHSGTQKSKVEHREDIFHPRFAGNTCS